MYDLMCEQGAGAKPLHRCNIDVPRHVINKLDNRTADWYFMIDREKQLQTFQVGCQKLTELAAMYAARVTSSVSDRNAMVQTIIDTESRLWMMTALYSPVSIPPVTRRIVRHISDDMDSDSEDVPNTAIMSPSSHPSDGASD